METFENPVLRTLYKDDTCKPQASQVSSSFFSVKITSSTKTPIWQHPSLPGRAESQGLGPDPAAAKRETETEDAWYLTKCVKEGLLPPQLKLSKWTTKGTRNVFIPKKAPKGFLTHNALAFYSLRAQCVQYIRYTSGQCLNAPASARSSHQDLRSRARPSWFEESFAAKPQAQLDLADGFRLGLNHYGSAVLGTA